MAVARDLAPRDRFARPEKYFNPIREKASCHGHGNTPMANRRLEVVESAEQAGTVISAIPPLYSPHRG